MTHFEHQVFSIMGSPIAMAKMWRECAEAAGPPVLFMGLTTDYQQNGSVQIPTVYVLVEDEAEIGAEQQRLGPMIDAVIADARSRYGSIQRDDLYCDRDKAIWDLETAERFQIRLFTARELRDIRAAEKAEEYRLSPGKNIAARHPVEVARIEDYGRTEFHVFYHTDAIWMASQASGLRKVIENELIEYCHQIGRTDRTLDNTTIISSSLEELGRDYIAFYK